MVSIAQIFIIPYDMVGNHKRLRSAVKQAAKAGAELIAFPEAVMSAGKLDKSLAEAVPGGPTLNYIIELAKSFKIW